MSSRDRTTPVDPVPRAKAPSRPDDERAKREAISAAKKMVGAQRGQVPPPPYRPRQDTIREVPAPPSNDAALNPYGQPAGSLPPPSSDPKEAQLQALRREVDAYRAGRKHSPPGGIASVDVSESGRPPARGDWARLRLKVATAIVAALVLVIGALALWAVAAIDAKREAIKAAQEARQKADTRDAEWRRWASVVTWIEDCRDARDTRAGEMLLPDAQKMGTARKLEPWQNPCPASLPPPP